MLPINSFHITYEGLVMGGLVIGNKNNKFVLLMFNKCFVNSLSIYAWIFLDRFCCIYLLEWCLTRTIQQLRVDGTWVPGEIWGLNLSYWNLSHMMWNGFFFKSYLSVYEPQDLITYLIFLKLWVSTDRRLYRFWIMLWKFSEVLFDKTVHRN